MDNISHIAKLIYTQGDVVFKCNNVDFGYKMDTPFGPEFYLYENECTFIELLHHIDQALINGLHISVK